MDKLDTIINESIHNMLGDYRKSTANHARMVSINEINAKTLISRHSENGYIVISPCRGMDDFKDIIRPNGNEEEQLSSINRKRVDEIIPLIKQSGFSYTPVYGGFIENKGKPGQETVYERSFVIYSQNRDGENMDFKKLYDFGIALAKKFNQDSFLCKAPNENPKYIPQNGDVDTQFNGKLSFNDLSQTYFTDLHKNTDKFDDMDKRRPTRFSFIECYINPAPQCLSEAHTRYLSNEITIPYKK